MFINRLGFSILQPFFSPDDMGGGGGGMDNGGSNTVTPSNTDTSNAVAEPSVIDINDDALIRVKGSDKPVKFGEHIRGFQSQWTKAAQEASRLKAEVAREREIRQRYEQERQRTQQNPQQNGQNQDVFAALKALPYLNGEQAADMAQAIASEIKQRDQITLGVLKQMQQMQGILNNLNRTHTSQSFESKITKFLTDGGYDPGTYGDLAKELYLAYEGADLDQEFPNILKSRVDGLKSAWEREKTQRVNAARQQPFLPGRGGDIRPSKPMQFKGNESAKEIAEKLWPSFESET
jgi:hypothetical protein